MSQPSANVGAKLGLLAALLLIVASALLFDVIYRGPATPAGALPSSDRLLVVTIGGDRDAANRAPARRTPNRQAPVQRTQQHERASGSGGRREQPPPRVRRYQVRKGQSLCAISDEVYGTEGRWKDIAQENGLREPWVITPGQTLRLPD